MTHGPRRRRGRLACVRKVTLELPDALVEAAKRSAGQQGTTLRALVIEGLERVLARPTARGGRRLEDLRVGDPKERFQPAPGIDPRDWDLVRALLYEGRGG
jgi:hypothetical protein